MYHGLKLCWEYGFRRIELESDFQVAIQKLGVTSGPSDIGFHLSEPIREFRHYIVIGYIRIYTQ